MYCRRRKKNGRRATFCFPKMPNLSFSSWVWLAFFQTGLEKSRRNLDEMGNSTKHGRLFLSLYKTRARLVRAELGTTIIANLLVFALADAPIITCRVLLRRQMWRTTRRAYLKQ